MVEGYSFSNRDNAQFERLKEEFNRGNEFYIEEVGNNYVVRRNTFSDEERAEEIRDLRKAICFPVINRGELWYNRISDSQLDELNRWYEAWLNAPQTLVIPEKPSWLE